VEWKGSAVKSLSVSYGMVQGAQYPDKNVDELIALADEDMYWQKRNYYRTAGRDRRKIL
jgi:GGDEF domain-containing protein